MTYWRICIETILPPGMRPDPSSKAVENAIGQQVPVSEWMEFTEAFRIERLLYECKPVNKCGLLYGHQEKKTDEPWRGCPFMFRIIELGKSTEPQSVLLERLNAIAAERDAHRAAVLKEIIRRVDEFLAGHSVEAYGLVWGLDIAARSER